MILAVIIKRKFQDFREIAGKKYLNLHGSVEL